MFLDHFKIFPFSSTLHSNKREWTTGTHTCAAWRYYVQKKKKKAEINSTMEVPQENLWGAGNGI